VRGGDGGGQAPRTGSDDDNICGVHDNPCV